MRWMNQEGSNCIHMKIDHTPCRTSGKSTFVSKHFTFDIIHIFDAGPMQRMFYRRDRHCFLLNWVVIVDLLGQVVLSRPGFIGRVHDSNCFRSVIYLELCVIAFLFLPNHELSKCYATIVCLIVETSMFRFYRKVYKIMADQGFEHRHPVIVLPHRNQPQVPAAMRRFFLSTFFG